jgi:1,4-alpha-glucan branching enzyme
MMKKQYVKSRKVAKVRFEMSREHLPAGVEVETVHLVGDFNGWDGLATPMNRRKSDGAYYLSMELEPGREYQFRYLVNGTIWCNDWEADGYVPGDRGADNCIVATPSQ